MSPAISAKAAVVATTRATGPEGIEALRVRPREAAQLSAAQADIVRSPATNPIPNALPYSRIVPAPGRREFRFRQGKTAELAGVPASHAGTAGPEIAVANGAGPHREPPAGSSVDGNHHEIAAVEPPWLPTASASATAFAPFA
ncbi:MAG TPA: hypothetical protein VGU70_19365 [Methylobacterium sp.]|uniref:hypothetical protein n=1 Tax=Methylorubrum sp. B1-46 TaxID=2897334 RepID=UPI001E61DF4F|nr:hypothetical protein [Methylorubrum sp. B1-46]UGB28579.1 hypothetical protein LPC10_22345 [Methylorubrum sp. B1-46]HEV2544918.1 hypothetical protein [Methylobacterium sp.]